MCSKNSKILSQNLMKWYQSILRLSTKFLYLAEAVKKASTRVKAGRNS